MLKPEPDQASALEDIANWFNRTDVRVFRLGGLAGTGKSSLTPLIPNLLGLSASQVHYCAPTNKARRVVQRKLNDAGIRVNVTTVHRLLYHSKEMHCNSCPLVLDDRNSKSLCHGMSSGCGCVRRFDKRANVKPFALIIVDEASMLSLALYQDLLTLLPTARFLFIGDHGQLPPVDKFGNKKWTLMERPEYELTQIQRTAAESPITRLAHEVRKSGVIPYGEYGPDVIKVALNDPRVNDLVDPTSDVGITFFRKQMNQEYYPARVNRLFRNSLGRGAIPEPGDHVIALANMDSNRIPKGSLGIIQEIQQVDEVLATAVIALEDDTVPYYGTVDLRHFNAAEFLPGGTYGAWDYSYALTCHQAQGSEFDSIVVFEPGAYFRTEKYDYKRWIYTAVTRAKRKLTIIG